MNHLKKDKDADDRDADDDEEYKFDYCDNSDGARSRDINTYLKIQKLHDKTTHI